MTCGFSLYATDLSYALSCPDIRLLPDPSLTSVFLFLGHVGTQLGIAEKNNTVAWIPVKL